jgi:NAD-dependent SIR2 family protein deacetylase
MPQCRNCGAHVTPQYARVFTPNEVEQPRVCPDCPDRIRRQGEVVEARSQRRSGR